MATVHLLAFLVFVQVAHFVADFVLQTQWQSSNKSHNWWALLGHMASYSLGMAVLLSPYLWFFFWPMLGWLLSNIVLHFITDAITSRVNARLWMEIATRRVDIAPYMHRSTWVLHGGTHNFFVGVGADQAIHQITFILTTWWWFL